MTIIVETKNTIEVNSYCQLSGYQHSLKYSLNTEKEQLESMFHSVFFCVLYSMLACDTYLAVSVDAGRVRVCSASAAVADICRTEKWWPM